MYYTVKKKTRHLPMLPSFIGVHKGPLCSAPISIRSRKKVATNTGRFSADLVSTSQIEARSRPEHEGNEETQNDEELPVRDWLVSKGVTNGVLIASREEKLTPTAENG